MISLFCYSQLGFYYAKLLDTPEEDCQKNVFKLAFRFHAFLKILFSSNREIKMPRNVVFRMNHEIKMPQNSKLVQKNREIKMP